MRAFLTLVYVLFIGVNSFSQQEKYANTITGDELREDLIILAADSMLGRETGKEGQKKAERFLVSRFKEIGLKPGNGDSFVQPFDLVTFRPDGALIVEEEQFTFIEDFYFYNKYVKDLKAKEIVFAGYGISAKNYDDYENIDVKGKVVFILEDEPLNKKGKSIITGTEELSEWSQSWRKKYNNAVKKGAKAVFTIVADYENKKNIVQYFLNSARMSLKEKGDKGEVKETPNLYISPKAADRIFSKGNVDRGKLTREISKSGKPNTITFIANLELNFLPNGDELISSNVIGVIEGTDKKDEYVVITAHYDHLGANGDLIFNGADDDGSGTVTLLEIAEAFKLAKDAGEGPRRTIVFMAVSGEEKGLLGSDYYTRNPIYPLEQTVVNLNVDMIGRHDTAHDNSNYVYLIGSDRLSTDLHDLNEEMNEEYTKLELDYTYNAEDDPNQFYQRSDHYNFAKNYIPVIFYFSGVHEDYHQPTDTPDKIEYNKAATIGKLIFHTAWAVANREEKLKVDQPIDWE